MNANKAESTFRVSQNLDVLRPQSGQAYPIPCADWNNLKSKIALISDEALTHQNLGWLFIGATFTTLIAILTGSFAVPSGSITTKEIIAWAVVAVTLICGLLSLHFAQLRRKDTKVKSADVLNQMKIIEERYQPAP
jgi:hypothetical protein